MKDVIREVIKEILIPELNEIKTGIHRLDGRVDEISSRIGDTNLQIIELSRRVDETNNRIDAVREDITHRIDETNKRIDETNNRIDTINADLTARIDTINADLTARIDAQTGRIDVLSEQVSDLRMEFAEFKGREKLIEDLTGRVNRLESKVIS